MNLRQPNWPWLTVKSAQVSSVRYTLQNKVLRACRPAGRGGFLIHAGTVLGRWTTSANGPDDPVQMTGAATLKLSALALRSFSVQVFRSADMIVHKG